MDREAEFLRAQIELARQRLRDHAHALSRELTEPLQLRPLIRRRPWLSLGSAALGGFASAFGLRRLLRRAPTGAGRAAGRGLLWVGTHLRGLLGSALATVLAANLRPEPASDASPRRGAAPPPPPPPPAPSSSSVPFPSSTSS